MVLLAMGCHMKSLVESPKSVLTPIWHQTLGVYRLVVPSVAGWMARGSGSDGL
jgi:hypothetical protein